MRAWGMDAFDTPTTIHAYGYLFDFTSATVSRGSTHQRVTSHPECKQKKDPRCAECNELSHARDKGPGHTCRRTARGRHRCADRPESGCGLPPTPPATKTTTQQQKRTRRRKTHIRTVTSVEQPTATLNRGTKLRGKASTMDSHVPIQRMIRREVATEGTPCTTFPL